MEKLADQRPDVAPDLDPYLLKHITGSLDRVIAEWNLYQRVDATAEGAASATLRHSFCPL
jgi:hypothetical protein